MISGRRHALIGATLGAALAGLAHSATLDTLEITKEHGRYQLVAETHLEAPAARIHSVLLEYDDNLFSRISSVYKESRYLDPDVDGTPIIYTRMEGCILFFCKSMQRTERLEAEAPRFIRTVTLPEDSDFNYSYSEWILEPDADGTRMKYVLIMDPKFWVPPIIGPWFIKRAISSGGLRAVERIERMARGESLPRRGVPRDVSHDASHDARHDESRDGPRDGLGGVPSESTTEALSFDE